MICSLLYKATPDDVKLIMVDPKRIELSSYDGIPHLITPVVVDAKKATNALFWAVREMERRYELLAKMNTRNISQYNKKIESNENPDADSGLEKLPYLVIVIDELADLAIDGAALFAIGARIPAGEIGEALRLLRCRTKVHLGAALAITFEHEVVDRVWF